MFNLFSSLPEKPLVRIPNTEFKLMNGGRPRTNNHTTEYNSGIYRWFSYDDENTYQQNLKSKPIDWQWRDSQIRYTVNSQHYRCSEWNQVDWNNSVLILGCSMVFGLGLDDDQTVSAKLSRRINQPVINLGVPGTSAMFQWMNTTRLLEHRINPVAVIYIWPHHFRVSEITGQDDQRVCGRWNFKTNNLSRAWSECEIHSLEYTRTCVESVKQQWHCPTLHYTYCLQTSKYLPEIHRFGFDEYLDYSRDDKHPGPKTVELWVDRISADI
jgi:hypothetical protein